MSQRKNGANSEKSPIIPIFIIILIFLDQLTKIITANLNLKISSLFQIIGTKNYGSAFSIFSNFTYYPQIISVISVIAIILIIKYKTKIFQNKLSHNTAFALIIAGIFSNLLDRITFGYVLDWIRIPFFSTFNFADIYLTIAAIILLVSILHENKTLKSESVEHKHGRKQANNSRK